MRKIKRFLASLLVGTMLAGTMSVAAYAATETTKQGWKLEDGYWYLYRNGEARVNHFQTDNGASGGGRTYFLGDDGKMVTDEIIHIRYNDEGKMRPDYPDVNGQYENQLKQFTYAYPDGHLMQNGWTMLDDEGHRAYNEDSANWYYFKDMVALKDLDTEDDTNDGIYEIDNATWAFDSDGIMKRAEWVYDKYFTYMGKRAESDTGIRALYIPDPSGNDYAWYKFDAEGNAKIWDVASKSDARRMAPVTEVTFLSEDQEELGDSITVEVGEEVTLFVDVEMASPSNAEYQDAVPKFDTRYHDIYLQRDIDSENDNRGMLTKSVSAKINYEKEEKTIKNIKYKADAPGVVNLVLKIDNIEAVIQISSVMPEEDTVVADATVTMLDNMLSSVGGGLDNDALGAVVVVAANSGAAKEAIANVVVDKKDKIAAFESTYGMINGVE
ncbi:MAG: hypothetical protein IJ374_10765, partial [Lachnospiraceae bacterium]|nr:hypothetical protein [Lachnospiraceae bacterium]